MAGQLERAAVAMHALTPLLRPDIQLVLGHGNGPQVGHILTRVEHALGSAYEIPLEVCVAESVGELGYVLQQALHNTLVERGIARSVVSLLNQVLVDEHDPAFGAPTKFIGPVYDAARAAELRAAGFAVELDAARGYRRVVASPEPREIIEADVVQRLMEMSVIAIAAGGGGVPVVDRAGQLHGVEAVIDKDLTAALLGERIGADLLVILTDVPCAYTDFLTPKQAPIHRADPDTVRALAAAGHFAPGSMGPKLEAAARFATRPGCRAIICDAASLQQALAGNAGTIIEARVANAEA
jgi:carbamate kinase